MSYFLFARGADGSLRPVAETFFETRQEALARLSELTSDPAFDAWDDEVFVADLDDATPVLLVRPSTPPSPAGEPEPAPEVITEAEPAATAPTLADALRGATTALESEGIVAPASIDASLALEELYSEPAITADSPETPRPDAAEIEAEEHDEPTESSTPAEATPETADAGADSLAEQPEPVPAGDWPWDVAPLTADVTAEEPLADDAGSEFEAMDQDAQAEAAAEDEADTGVVHDEYTPDPLEEPSVDDVGLLPPVLDAEGISVRPVILGDYDHSSPPATAEHEAEDVFDSPAEPSAPPAEPAGGMTCDQCVYVSTCPHKGDRDPTTCGSFQWVSA